MPGSSIATSVLSPTRVLAAEPTESASNPHGTTNRSSLLLAVPSGVLTATRPDVAVAGTVTASSVGFALSTEA